VLVAVVLPTYNESENIARLLTQLRQVLPDSRLFVVDDNSPDGTGDIAERCAVELGGIEVLHRPGKQGLGSAYRQGFAHVISQGVDVVVSMDVDFSHDPLSIPACLQQLNLVQMQSLVRVT